MIPELHWLVNGPLGKVYGDVPLGRQQLGWLLGQHRDADSYYRRSRGLPGPSWFVRGEYTGGEEDANQCSRTHCAHYRHADGQTGSRLDRFFHHLPNTDGSGFVDGE